MQMLLYWNVMLRKDYESEKSLDTVKEKEKMMKKKEKSKEEEEIKETQGGRNNWGRKIRKRIN